MYSTVMQCTVLWSECTVVPAIAPVVMQSWHVNQLVSAGQFVMESLLGDAYILGAAAMESLNKVLCCTSPVLNCVALLHLSYTVLYCTILYRTMLYLSHTVVCCTVLCCSVVYCNVLYQDTTVTGFGFTVTGFPACSWHGAGLLPSCL